MDDLERVKKELALKPSGSQQWFKISCWQMNALIARLEAAEKVCNYIYGYPDLVPYEKKLLQAWREAKGE